MNISFKIINKWNYIPECSNRLVPFCILCGKLSYRVYSKETVLSMKSVCSLVVDKNSCDPMVWAQGYHRVVGRWTWWCERYWQHRTDQKVVTPDHHCLRVLDVVPQEPSAGSRGSVFLHVLVVTSLCFYEYKFQSWHECKFVFNQMPLYSFFRSPTPEAFPKHTSSKSFLAFFLSSPLVIAQDVNSCNVSTSVIAVGLGYFLYTPWKWESLQKIGGFREQPPPLSLPLSSQKSWIRHWKLSNTGSVMKQLTWVRLSGLGVSMDPSRN